MFMSTNYKTSILLVDDDEDDREFFSIAVRNSCPEMNFKSLNDGVEFLKYLDSNPNPPPNIVFLDTQMPKLSGLECLQLVRNSANWKDLPIIIYTTSPDKGDMEEAIKHGANLYVRKPYDFTKLESIVKSIANIDWSTRKPYSSDIFFNTVMYQ